MKGSLIVVGFFALGLLAGRSGCMPTWLMEGDISLHAVHKMKYRFNYEGHRFEIDVYPFSDERAIMRAAMPKDKDEIAIPPEVKILREVTNDPAYRNSQLAKMQRL